jgi:hypothetical protein
MAPAESMSERSTPSKRTLGKGPGGGVGALMRGALVALGALLAAACGGDESGSGKKDEGDFVAEWRPGASGLAKALKDEEVFEDLADGLNELFRLPQDLPIVHTACNEANAFWDPGKRQLSMCYELLDAITDISSQLAADDEELIERAIGTWMFVFFHELGHGLVDYYDLPITGKEEDAVDDFSAILMIEADLAEYAAYAAEFWAETGTGVEDVSQFADEHSLSEQRFFNILCLIFGSDPDKYESLVTGGWLPESRAVRCPNEYEQKSKAWETLLEPWAK